VNHENENNVINQHMVDKALCGDTSAFRTIMKNTEGLVAQIIFRMIPYSEDRKDIAQDIYLKTFKNLASFKFQAKLSTWVGQIAYNTCINYLEKKKLVFPGNISDDNGPVSGVFLSNATNPFDNQTEERIFKKELSEILKTEIDKLSPVYKTLIMLYHNEDLSYAEIAQITELPEGTVKSYLYRARKALKDSLSLSYQKDML
jgi:RNA polymerase sigma-70 factor (ECF subfamily)